MKIGLWVGAVCLSFAAACGGESECEHLTETCAKCTDQTVKAACSAVASANNEANCESSHASYDMMCE